MCACMMRVCVLVLCGACVRVGVLVSATVS